MRTSLKKLQKFASHRHDRKAQKHHQSVSLDEHARATQVKKISSIPKKRDPTKFDSDFVDDDDALMQAIALSLQDTETSGAHLPNPAPPPNEKRKENPPGRDGSGKKKGRKPVTSRVQMNEDEMLIHFFHFDESGRGSITLRDVARLAAVHDFTWNEKEMADMIYCFDSDGDGKISFDTSVRSLFDATCLKTLKRMQLIVQKKRSKSVYISNVKKLKTSELEALRMLLRLQAVKRFGVGGRSHPYIYMIA